MGLRFTVPYPPSVNSYWRHPTKGKLAGRHLISAFGRAYRHEVMAECMRQKVFKKQLSGRLEINLYVVPPDNRRRDLDNVPKAVFDSLQHAGVVLDDSQFDRILITRGQKEKPEEKAGLVYILITPYLGNDRTISDCAFLRPQAD